MFFISLNRIIYRKIFWANWVLRSLLFDYEKRG
jgi:hypothetical protein